MAPWQNSVDAHRPHRQRHTGKIGFNLILGMKVYNPLRTRNRRPEGTALSPSCFRTLLTSLPLQRAVMRVSHHLQGSVEVENFLSHPPRRELQNINTQLRSRSGSLQWVFHYPSTSPSPNSFISESSFLVCWTRTMGS